MNIEQRKNETGNGVIHYVSSPKALRHSRWKSPSLESNSVNTSTFCSEVIPICSNMNPLPFF